MLKADATAKFFSASDGKINYYSNKKLHARTINLNKCSSKDSNTAPCGSALPPVVSLTAVYTVTLDLHYICSAALQSRHPLPFCEPLRSTAKPRRAPRSMCRLRNKSL
ncbi:hypothetical protein ILYODFUR_012187 [Ilyodon furcidens]|uniref:Uncharacterized protein n=1 Tax=Ilyodon furcidens TaxID=33524 RepID=A0ABV0T7B4_9TELE